jgi:F420-dependent oxidoreductase-like protein
MRIGIFVSETWGAASAIGEVRDRARRAEALGFAGGWVPYLPWSLDAFAAIQAAGEATKTLLLGTAVVPTYFFHPLAMARQAATVQAAIGRPIELGVGCSNVAVISMHGLPYERPARHVREYVEILAAALAAGEKPMGEREKAGFVQYAGDFFALGSIYGTPQTTRPGRLLVGALGPQMLRVAGAFTDGTIATWADAGAIERGIVPALTRAAREAARPAPTVAGVVAVCITNRADEVRAFAQAEFGFYEGAMPYRRMLEVGNAKKISEVCVIGDEETVARRLREFAEAGMTDFLAAPLAYGESTWEFTAERLAAIRR